jgi:uncharacterized repeat protein (TIGR03803 family)
VIHRFDGSDGSEPEAALVEGTDGNLYGTTLLGSTSGVGTVFRISKTGTFTTLYSFPFPFGSNGGFPYSPCKAPTGTSMG